MWYPDFAGISKPVWEMGVQAPAHVLPLPGRLAEGIGMETETETELGWYHNQEPEGRRIYVHEESLRALARRSNYAADLVFSALGRATVAKILHHHLMQAIEFGSMDSSKARDTLERVRTRFGESLTLALRQIGYQPLEHSKHDFYPILRSGEHVNAFCLESGYFTFATGDKAAGVMYAEKGSMHEERAAIRAGTGPRDLTWINARRLALLDANLPIGPGAAVYYFAGSAQRASLSPTKVSACKRRAVFRLLSETDTLIRGKDAWQSPDEKYVLNQLSLAYQWALSKGIFADAQSARIEASSRLADRSCEYSGAC